MTVVIVVLVVAVLAAGAFALTRRRRREPDWSGDERPSGSPDVPYPAAPHGDRGPGRGFAP